MQFSIAIAALAAFAGVSNACYLIAHSSTVGNFDVQHSAPSDHGGAPQTITGSYKGCSFSGGLSDSCTVSVTKNSGCGTLSFTINHSGKRAEQFSA